MAFPTVSDETIEAFATNTTEHLVDMPATVDSGDLLLVMFTNDATDTVTTPTGWTQLFSEIRSPNVRHGGYYKIADGTEGGTTVDFVTSGTETAMAVVYRITSWHGTTPPEVGTFAEATSTTPDPPSLTPSWGAEDTLWIAHFGANDNGTGTVSAFPTSYTNGLSGRANNVASSCMAGSARRNLNATSDDPGTFTKNNSDAWVANLTAIRPAAGGGIVLLDGTAAAVSSLAGALPVDKALGGSIPAVAALSGELPVSRLMVSTVAAVSTLAGELPVDKGLVATIPATSIISGALALEWALAGTVPAVSTLTGDLTVPGEIVLSGLIPATSSLSGDLPVSRLMVSTIAAASTLDAILGKYRAINGSCDAVSTLTGDLQRLRALAGAIAGGSTLAGALKLQWALRGILAGLATVSGDLTVELGFPWTREQLLNAEDISGPALRAPHRKEIE